MFFSLPPCCKCRRMNLNVARHFPTCGRIAVPAVRYCTTPHHCKRSDFFPHARVTLTSITRSAATEPPHLPPLQHRHPTPSHTTPAAPPPHAAQAHTQSQSKWRKKAASGNSISRDVATDSVKLLHFNLARKTPLLSKTQFQLGSKSRRESLGLRGALLCVRRGSCVLRHATHTSLHSTIIVIVSGSG